MPNFQAAGASVLGISGDGIDTQKEFSAKECRDTFPVGADPDFSVIKAYDASFAGFFAKRISLRDLAGRHDHRGARGFRR